MVNYTHQFLPAYDRALRGRPRPNPDQDNAIVSGSNALFVVAGPGSGKTTVIALRILKQIFCDRVPPYSVLATTFTVKAAAELRSRILGWGFGLRDELLVDRTIMDEDRRWVESVDINQVITGTLDSVCQEVLSQNRAPAEQSPVLIDGYLASTLLVRKGLFTKDRYQDPALDGWLMQVAGTTGFGWNLGSKRQALSAIWDRLQQDLSDVSALAKTKSVPAAAKAALSGALQDYEAELAAHNWLDFGLLERRVLQKLRARELDEWAGQFRSVFVDEYQDTNLLQEQIYFELVGRGGCALTVVGDDDQSLYRFRGASVELFRDFPGRLNAQTSRVAETAFLNKNYRSTDPIIAFSDAFIRSDDAFQSVRVKDKPRIKSPDETPGLPVLGMFRGDPGVLATDLAEFICRVASPRGFELPGGEVLMVDARKGGALGDICVLASSPAEYKRSPPSRPGATPPNPELRLPGRLRAELAARGVGIFNPRGEPLGEVQVVKQLAGLLLEALDDRGMVQATEKSQKRMGPDAQRRFPVWRNEGRLKQRSDKELDALIRAWQARDRPGAAPAGYRWPTSVAALELLYGIIHYLPEFHDDPEGQAYLEVFTRQLTAMSAISGFEGRIVTSPANRELSQASIRDLLCDWLAPIASDTVELDEEMIGSFPRHRLSVLSIHQSKGLEFPLVIVDIGSDFKGNHHAHAFKRFPRNGAMSHTLEDLIRPLAGVRLPPRAPEDRAFDDLERLFYVAFTRAQKVLMLVGLDGSRPYRATIPNVGAGWDRAGARHGAAWDITYV